MAVKHVKNFVKYRYLLLEIIRKNIKLQYRSSVLGMFWTFLQPLLTTMVLAVIFGYIFGRNEKEVICFPVYLLSGRLLYEFFTGSTKRAMRSIRNNAGIIKKVYVPKYIYPLGNIASSFVTFLISLSVLAVFIAYYKGIVGKDIQITHYMFYSIIPIAILFLLSVGVGMILAVLEVFFKDIEYLYDVFCTLLFYMTPMFYTLNSLFGKKLTSAQLAFTYIIRGNPLYGIVTMFRNCVLFGKPIQAHDFWYTLIFSCVLILIGTAFFYKKQDKFILHI